ncbi:MAG: ABC transporter ATP-binding protein [Candidatus Jordarchaeum sp.]|uniref:ABC transporter ATP-binding protein n=1 Tax=Candidatus Jordarchaeum sp. TaxID=2823881 RepID=UPI00404B598A
MKKRIIDEGTRWVLQFIKKYTWIFVGIIFLQFIENYSFTFLPRVSTNFLFELFTPEKIQQIYKYFFLALLIIFIKGTLGYITSYSLSITTENAANNLRVRFFQHLVYLPLHYFKKNKTGNIISMVIDDISKIRVELYESIVRIISQVIFVIIILVKLILLNLLLTIISFSIIPALYITLRIVGQKMKQTSARLQQNIANISSNLHETIGGIDVVKSFAREDYEVEKFRKTSSRYKNTSLKLKILQNLFKPLNEMIFYFFGFILIGIAGFFIIRGDWTVKHLTEYLILLGILFTPINNIPKTLANFKVVSASIERVYNVIKETNTIKEPPHAIKKKTNGNIRFENVCFSYDDKEPVLKDVSFEVKCGDVVAIVGSSGAGKTTIVNLIPRFYDPDSGRVVIDEIDIKEYSIKNLRSQIGIVSQNVALFNDTIYENIRYSKLDATEEEIIQATKKAHAFDFIMRLPNKFETVVGERGTRLSGGEKQRIAIARTILINPRILILDEATSALDSESEYLIQQALNELMEGKTSIVIAHRLSTITHAKKILVLYNGTINAIGTHEYLLKNNEIYRRLYERQYFK